MRAELELGVRRWWAGDAGAAGLVFSAAALPAELLFRAAVALRGSAYDAGVAPVERAPVPVICVGNLTVGGTGKTPLAGWVVRQLLAAGRRPGLALRGWGMDEQQLHRRWNPEMPIHAAADRADAARALAEAGADVVVLDDGFQHRRLARDLDLVVLSAEQPFPGALLPRGPYREPPTALARADWVIVTRRSEPAAGAERLADHVRRIVPAARVAQARLAPAGWSALDGSSAAPPAGEALSVSGIGEPAAFASMVGEATGAAVERLDFPDHHPYAPADIERIRRAAAGRPIAITEKDAVKLAHFVQLLPDARVLALAVRFDAGEAALRDSLLAAAGTPTAHRPPGARAGTR